MDHQLQRRLTEAGVLINDHNLARIDGPRFVHDCDRCLYLGTWCGADLYVCTDSDESKVIDTVIARFSDDPPDYASSVHIAREKAFPGATHRELRVAYLLALDCGFIDRFS